jgi:hypothetical protein
MARLLLELLSRKSVEPKRASDSPTIRICARRRRAAQLSRRRLGSSGGGA